jgi:hypothetical protein
MIKETNMLKVINELRATMTPEEFRNEILGGIAFLIGFPILFTALWIVTPA